MKKLSPIILFNKLIDHISDFENVNYTTKSANLATNCSNQPINLFSTGVFILENNYMQNVHPYIQRTQ